MTRLRSARGAHRSRGVVLIELAIISPVLVLLVLGIFEFGNAWRQVGGLERAAQAGARTVTAQANARYADYEALRAIDSATRGLQGVTIDQVVIFRTTDGSMPAACASGSVAGTCNTYTGTQLRTASPAGFPPGTTCAGGWDTAWCPTTRAREGVNRMLIGVHVSATYSSVTGLLPGPTITITRSAVYQIEPCAQGQSGC